MHKGLKHFWKPAPNYNLVLWHFKKNPPQICLFYLTETLNMPQLTSTYLNRHNTNCIHSNRSLERPEGTLSDLREGEFLGGREIF